MFETTWVYEANVLTLNFIKSKFKSSISDEDLASELICVISAKNTHQNLDFYKNIKYLTYNFCDNYILKW